MMGDMRNSWKKKSYRLWATAFLCSALATFCYQTAGFAESTAIPSQGVPQADPQVVKRLQSIQAANQAAERSVITAAEPKEASSKTGADSYEQAQEPGGIVVKPPETSPAANTSQTKAPNSSAQANKPGKGGPTQGFLKSVNRLRRSAPDAFANNGGLFGENFFKNPPMQDLGQQGQDDKKSPPAPAPTSNQAQGIPIKRSGTKMRGSRINSEVPSVRHIEMAPASKKYGGDDIEIIVSPIYDVLLQMPEDVEFFRSSSLEILFVDPVKTNPNILTLKMSPDIANPTPVSLHIVDVSQNIYTFTVIGYPTDLSIEYPKTVIISKRRTEVRKLGPNDPSSLLRAMDINDAVQMVVGDMPRTNEYEVEVVSAKYMHYQGFVMYGFRIFRRDRKKLNVENLVFTIWADNQKIEGSTGHSLQRGVEWVIEPTLSARESRRRDYEVARVFVQIRSSIQDIEDWRTAFLTVSDGRGFTKFDFIPFSRSFRAPHKNKSQGRR